MESTKRGIKQVKEIFEPVARRVARFFFCLESMSNVNEMYQYSLRSYENIFEDSMKEAEKGADKKERI